MQGAHSHFQQVSIHHLFANFYFERSEGKSRHSLVFIYKYYVKTAGSSEQLTVPLVKGPFPFAPSLPLLAWIPGQEEEEPEVVVRVHGVQQCVTGFLVVCFLFK